MTLFVVRREVLKAAYADPEYGRRLTTTETISEIESVMVEFCRKHGYKVAEVPLK
jgi:hypothetical protein